MTRARAAIAWTTATLSVGAAAAAFSCGGGDDSAAQIDAGSDGEGADGGNDASPGDAGAGPQPPKCTATPCAIDLAVGGTHSCALLADGTVRCWGSNFSGELASGGFLDGGAFDGGGPAATPLTVTAIAGATSVAAGGQGQTADFSCVSRAGGAVTCWGSNKYGQLGTASSDGGFDPANRPAPADVAAVTGAARVVAGASHTCALDTTGKLSCWGFNALDQLGRPGAGASTAVVARVVGLPDDRAVVQVSAGQFHTCALLADGTVLCWGEDAKGQLGRTLDAALQDPTPLPVTGLSGVKQISAGNFHTCAVLDAGLALCWGQNDHGQTGRGAGGAAIEPSPALVALPAGSRVAQISAGLLHTCAVLADDGSVWCWGGNQAGAVGAGTGSDGGFVGTDVVVPTRVAGLPGPALRVAAGYLHTCALLDGGAVWCWGSNQFAELGRGAGEAGAPSTAPHPAPAAVAF